MTITINDKTLTPPASADHLLYQVGDLNTGTNNKVGWKHIKWGKAVTKTAAYTATIEDEIILCETSSVAFTVTLPSAASAYDDVNGYGQTLKITNTGTNNLTVAGNGGELVLGVASQIIAGSPVGDETSIAIISNGLEWHRL